MTVFDWNGVIGWNGTPPVKMRAMTPRPYRQSRRAADTARTRRRIIAATRRLTVTGATPSVDAIAGTARVSPQTIYSHFGSKRGLLLAKWKRSRKGKTGFVKEVTPEPAGEL